MTGSGERKLTLKQREWMILLIAGLIIGSAITLWKVETHLGLDLVGGVRGVFLASSQTSASLTQRDMDTAVSVIDRRVNRLGVSEAQVQQKGTDQIIVEIPLAGQVGKKMTADQAMDALMSVVKAAKLEFSELPDNIDVQPGKRNEKGEETFTFSGPNGPMTEQEALAQGKVFITGADLLPNCQAQFDPNDPSNYAVTMQFNDKGTLAEAQHSQAAKDREAATGKKQYFAIVLDGHLLTYPYVKSPILDGSGEISGGFPSLEDAQHLAVLLNAGALPVDLKPLQTSLIEATLGASAVRTSVWAGIFGLCLVVLFMWGYYRLPGVLASLALLIYSLLVFAIFKLIPVTLTLPGIAGFILSVGMAVDANILIFERLKEELRDGRTLRAAIDAGFSRAFTAIFDSNACTLITCGVLGFYGTGPVKGFAVTLAIGVITSLFTAITVTRTFLHFLDNLGALQKPEYFGIDIQWMGKWAQGRDIIGNRKFYYALSLAVIVPGLLFLCCGQLRRGVDFTGGNEWIIASRQHLSDATVGAALAKAGIPRNHYDLQIGSSLQTSENLATIHSQEGVVPQEIQPQVLANLHSAGVADAATASQEHIAPVIGKELEANAFKAVLIASLLIVIYLTFRFAQGGFKDGLKYGVCAVIAMLHDVFVVVGLFAIFGALMQIEIDTNFVTAILTIIGFSVHDTIVIFDRVRENLRRRPRGEGFQDTYNRSIIQTAARSINTSFTVLLVLVALIIFGAPVIRWFNIALLIGIISGTYSSIFNASPLVVDWQIIKRRRELALAPAAKKGGLPERGFGVKSDPPVGNGASRQPSAPRASSSRADATRTESPSTVSMTNVTDDMPLSDEMEDSSEETSDSTLLRPGVRPARSVSKVQPRQKRRH